MLHAVLKATAVFQPRLLFLLLPFFFNSKLQTDDHSWHVNQTHTTEFEAWLKCVTVASVWASSQAPMLARALTTSYATQCKMFARLNLSYYYSELYLNAPWIFGDHNQSLSWDPCWQFCCGYNGQQKQPASKKTPKSLALLKWCCCGPQIMLAKKMSN